MAHKSHITIFEMGFGTGLNALLTLLQAEQMAQNVDYYAVELYPIPAEEACKANFSEQLGVAVDRFRSLHSAEWDKAVAIDNRFTLTKIQGDLVNLELPLGIDLVYFDAFDPEAQPELWSETIFKKLYEAMSNEGVLVTYSSKGIVKQALRAAGFFVQRLSGPPGKRHMVRAIKREHE
ncbi:tRNA U34 5-methylaminomethyl-2-thiouridine-forming methyltransferase MnmC [Williamwhitmania taraxaci]|uniref:tRNA U34 5-methylaminomethyl-2-thiouridine-forming methyltransferase MnmC n=2 Tax=Williamwhitmania taraxaci TaxID=1640674 RepID=A0A1G6GGC7_9BACT|nr:tRNA U34 5-methylaminomethyl-2-thiouridine-forming methyltransferase MnmC [Williamwhitmania taraxaci]